MILKGKIQRLLPMQQGTSQKGNQWQKVEFIVEGEGEHPDILCIAALNDKVTELVGINAGDEVEVEFNCRVNEYNGRVYNSLSLFKIAKAAQQGNTPAPMPQQQPFEQQQGPQNDDDLPF